MDYNGPSTFAFFLLLSYYPICISSSTLFLGASILSLDASLDQGDLGMKRVVCLLNLLIFFGLRERK